MRIEYQVQCVRWHPEQETYLLTAGFDKKIYIFDAMKSKDKVISPIIHLISS